MGMDWLWWPSRKAAVARSLEAVTAPCPPLCGNVSQSILSPKRYQVSI